MTPEIRAARPDEAEAVLQTLCAAFDLDADAARPIFQADPYYDLSHKRVLALPEAGIVSCLTVVPTLLRVGGVPVRTGGVAGVATLPPYRRRGCAAALLQDTVLALGSELGYPLSVLHPLAAPFYRQFGWEFATRALDWAAPVSSLPLLGSAAPVRPACAADWPALAALHDQLTRADTGACVRDDRRWRLIRMPVPGREAFVCEEAGEVAGYGLWERREALHLLEMHGRTPLARRSLLAHAVRQPEARLEWRTTPAALEGFGLEGFGLPLPASPVPEAMLRIVDLPAALAAVHPALYQPVLNATGLSLTLRAADTLRPANARPIRLTPDGVTPGTRRDPSWLRADIRILAQLYLGYQTPSEAAASGLVACDSAPTLALADRLFPARAPYIAPLDQV